MLNYEQVATFILIFIRVSTFLAVGPLFWLPSVPRLVKAGMSFVLALVLFPVIHPASLSFSGGLLGFGLACVEEACVGLGLGFVCGLIFHSLTIAGQLMDIQMGFFMSYIFDPTTGVQATIASRFLFFLGMVLFFILDGHHAMIAGLARSYDVVPITGIALKGVTALTVTRIFAQMISLAIQIAAPVVVIILVIDICLGLLGRTAPEMNIFMLGFPIKIGLGMLILSITIPLLGVILRNMMRMMEQDLYTVMRGLS